MGTPHRPGLAIGSRPASASVKKAAFGQEHPVGGVTIDDMNRRALRRGSAFVAALTLTALPVTPAFADGPGYGGDAGQLSVSWQAEPAATSSLLPPWSLRLPSSLRPPWSLRLPPPAVESPQALTFGGSVRGVGAVVQLPVAADPQLQNDSLALLVRGLGFRGKSAVEVRIGSSAAVVTRADSAGALAVALDPDQIGAAQPGVSVMAVGRNQSGTEVTLFGSVPPVADGSGPMSLVPWAAGAVALTGPGAVDASPSPAPPPPTCRAVS